MIEQFYLATDETLTSIIVMFRKTHGVIVMKGYSIFPKDFGQFLPIRNSFKKLIWKWTQFFPNSGRVDAAVWMHHLDADKTAGADAKRLLHKNAASNID